MGKLISQKYLEGIDSSKFKIEQGGAIKATDSSGSLVDVFKFDPTSNAVKVFNDEEVALKSQVDAEDATFIKLDGSRVMSGDLLVSNDSAGMTRKIKWESEVNNVLSSAHISGITTSYINTNNETTQSSEVHLGLDNNNGLKSVLNKPNEFNNGNLIDRGFLDEAYYNSTGIMLYHNVKPYEDSFSSSSGHLVSTSLTAGSLNFASDGPDGGYATFSINSFIVADQTSSIELNSDGTAFFSKSTDSIVYETMIDGNMITTKSVTLYDVESNAPFVPTQDAHATTKAYVDNSIVASMPVFDRARIEINISSKLEKVVLGSDAPDELTIIVFVNRLALHLNQDYSISNENGDYVLTWMGDFATGGVEAVELGDVVYVTYVKQK